MMLITAKKRKIGETLEPSLYANTVHGMKHPNGAACGLLKHCPAWLAVLNHRMSRCTPLMTSLLGL
eukprot:1137052-Pelagomonas_calceolata.AAC.2